MLDFVEQNKKKCSRCKKVLGRKHFRKENSTCKRCCEQVTLWNLENKSRYNHNKKVSYYRNQKEYLERLRTQRKSEQWKVSYHLAKQRCTNPNNPSYKHYGERGIKVKMTIKDFKFLWFRDKAYKMNIPTIDRINNDGHYELSNCRFIEKSENTRKRNYERSLLD